MKLKCKQCKADYTPDGSGNLCPKCYQKAVPEHFKGESMQAFKTWNEADKYRAETNQEQIWYCLLTRQFLVKKA
jgi:hypothetical protein